MKVSIIVAYRKEETDLQATIDSAKESAGKSVKIYAVEDKTFQGPGRTRNRGIEAATDADVVVIIDPHMRFKGDVIKRLAKRAHATGGLIVPFCHHGSPLSLDTPNHYAGGRILYKVKDSQGKKALDAKWSTDLTAGPRGCVMGACYAFPRQWYMDVGQPLAMLPGWGGDEEALSIAAWMSGHTPEVIDGHVAHLWRASPPWMVTTQEAQAAQMSRRAIICSVVSEVGARRELLAWCGYQAAVETPEITRFRAALLKLPRKWGQWRDSVCEPEEIDGKQIKVPEVAVDRPVKQATHVTNPVVIVPGIKCPHCASVHADLPVEHSYANSRRHKCPVCGNPFISMFKPGMAF